MTLSRKDFKATDRTSMGWVAAIEELDDFEGFWRFGDVARIGFGVRYNEERSGSV